MSRINETKLTRREALLAAGLVGTSALLVGCSKGKASEGDESGRTANDTDAPTEPSDTSSDAAPTTEPEQTSAQRLLASMTLEQKVAQLFFVTPEGLTGASTATVAGSMTSSALSRVPVGGVVYFSKNITGQQQTRDLLSGTVELSCQAGAGIPVFTGVDEEGGSLVARVANSGVFDVEKFPNMAQIGASGDETHAARVGSTIGGYLHDIGFSLDFAPDADVLTNPNNTAIGARSFGSDPELVSTMVAAEVKAMLATGTVPCVKHFPGHGDTNADSHTGAAISERTMDDLVSCEYKPFSAAIGAGCPMVMVGHISTPNAAADDLPASLSPTMITDELRGRLGFDGVVISDSMAMGAVSQYYSSAEAAVRFVSAGGDMILMPEDLEAAYEGVLSAVSDGTLSEERIDESVARIIAAKQAAGLIEP